MVGELGAVFFGLLSAASYGAGDFSGGIATRRTPVVGVIAIAHGIGLVLLLALALLTGETVPPVEDFAWGAVAGTAGLVGLAALYRGLAVGRAGVVAPITGVLSAALPAAFAFLTVGLPSSLQIVGFALGLVSVWLVSGAKSGDGASGIRLALVAGLGFGVFFVLLDRIGETAFFWPLAASRAASLSIMVLGLLVTNRTGWFPREPRALLVVVLAGLLDVGGNAFFVLAARTGRLDIAAVVSSLYPAMTILLARLILKEKVSAAQAVGVVGALAAIVLIAAG